MINEPHYQNNWTQPIEFSRVYLITRAEDKIRHTISVVIPGHIILELTNSGLDFFQLYLLLLILELKKVNSIYSYFLSHFHFYFHYFLDLGLVLRLRKGDLVSFHYSFSLLFSFFFLEFRVRVLTPNTRRKAEKDNVIQCVHHMLALRHTHGSLGQAKNTQHRPGTLVYKVDKHCTEFSIEFSCVNLIQSITNKILTCCDI